MEYLTKLKKKQKQVKLIQFIKKFMEKSLNYEKYLLKISNKIDLLQKNIQALAKTAITYQNVRALLFI